MTTVILRSYSALSWFIINNPGANVNHSVEVCRNFTETIKKILRRSGFFAGRRMNFFAVQAAVSASAVWVTACTMLPSTA